MIENYLTIMEESLIKKISVLDKIQDISDKQAQLLDEKDLNMEAFDAFVNEKDLLITELTRLDDGFQDIYQGVARELDSGKEKYHDNIKRLQELIGGITDKSMSIQAVESRNKTLVEKCFKNKRAELKQGRVSSKAALDYYKNMNGMSITPPQFVDKKK